MQEPDDVSSPPLTTRLEPPGACTTILELPITAVVVHPERARVERSGHLPLELRPGRLLVHGLPALLLESTLQVHLENSDLEIVELSSGWDLQLPSPEDVSGLEAAHKEAAHACERLRVQVRALEGRIAFYHAFAPESLKAGSLPFQSEAPLPDLLSAASAWEDALEILQRSLEQDQGRLRQVRVQLRDAETALELARARLSAASSTELSGPPRRSVAITLARRRDLEPPPAPIHGPDAPLPMRSAAAPPARITLSYLIPGATWAPAYEVRVSEDGIRASFAIRALVAQRTGEDWRGVRLSVSTADGTYLTDLPTLPALRIGRSQPPVPRTGWRPPPEGLEALFEAFDRDLKGRIVAPSSPWSAESQPKKRKNRSRRAQQERLREMVMEEADADDRMPPAAAAPPPMMAASPAFLAPPRGAMAAPAAFSGGPGHESNAPASLLARAPGAPPPSPPRAKMSGFPSPGRAGGSASSDEGKLAKQEMRDGTPEVADSFGGSPRMASEPALPQGLEVDTNWLGYDHLRMGGPGSPQRGQLYRPLLQEELMDQIADPELGWTAASLLEENRASAQHVPELALPRHASPVRLSRGRFDHRTDAALPLDVPSDGHLHTVTLLRADGPARIAYRTVPRVEPVVYRELLLANPLPSPLLPGPADLYLGSELVATSPLQRVDQGGELRLGLGVEERLRVARNTRYTETSSGVFTSSLHLDHEITLTVSSQLGLPVQVEVLERLPVTDASDIEIKELASSPQAQPYDQVERGVRVRGGRRFRLEVPAREEVSCRLAYRVILSAKQELVNGNRRD